MSAKQRRWKRVVGLAVVCAGLLGARLPVAVAQPAASDSSVLVTGNTQFALDLYDQVRSEEGNLFFSPYSISTALAMTYAGARGETARQMSDVLHLPPDQVGLHPAFAALEARVKAAGSDAHCALHVANSLWGQQGYGFLDEFLSLNKQHYGAAFHEVDFVGAPEEARRRISAWIAEQTQQLIKEMLRPGDLDTDDVLALVNALYFKGDWASQFDPRHTENAPFHASAKSTVEVPMMSQTAQFARATTGQLEILELPYAGERLSMVVLLPKERDGLAAVEKALSADNLARWLGELRPRTVRVGLPRFKLDLRVDLTLTLAGMGMPDAFSAGKADFSGMTGGRDLFIGMVLHQARIDVNEEGTEAAAATVVKMKRSAIPDAFVADHPFLFLIRDTRTGSILFLGRVVKPA
ncbi:MAG: serpin family protein [Planctomycetes bacterium]|nr:serpin family protein [Planctomycetota bacterium]